MQSFPDLLSDSTDNSGDESILTPNTSQTSNENLTTSSDKKKKKRKRKLPYPPEIRDNAHLKKYWHKRFSLFSKFDQGIKMDEGIFVLLSKQNKFF